MIDKEENILRKHLDNNQMIILMQNDLLHLIAMSMRTYKNEDILVKNLSLSGVSDSVVCGNCDGWGYTVDENGRRKEHCKECE
tara:strand:+ start:248 stop:496 length:249 start_codon:yes stop_codon:yes gene_type:complete